MRSLPEGAIPLIPWAAPPYGGKAIIGGRLIPPAPVWPPLYWSHPQLFRWTTSAPVDLYDYHFINLIMRSGVDQINKRRREAAAGVEGAGAWERLSKPLVARPRGHELFPSKYKNDREFIRENVPTPKFVEKWGRWLGGLCDTSRRLGVKSRDVELPADVLETGRAEGQGLPWLEERSLEVYAELRRQA